MRCANTYFKSRSFLSGPVFTRTKSLLLGGVDEYITMGNAAALDVANTDPFTITMWVKLVSGTGTYAGKAGVAGVNLPGYVWSNYAGSFRLYVGNLGGTYLDAYSVNTIATYCTETNWNFYAVKTDGSQTRAGTKFYVNNSAPISCSASGSDGVTTTTNTADFQVGYHPTFGAANANFDDLRFWKGVALSDAEILDVYNSGLPSDLRNHSRASVTGGYWWNGDSDTYPTIKDRKLSNDGTMTNMESTDIVSDSP